MIEFEGRDFGYVLAVEQEMQRLLLQPLTSTFRTFTNAVELIGPFLGGNSDVRILHLLNVFDQTIELRINIVRSLCLAGRNSKPLRTAFQNLVNRFVWNFAKRCINRTSILFEHSLHLPENHGLLGFAKWREAPISKRKSWIWDDFVAVDDMYEPQTFATRASTLRTVEREVVRRRVVIGNAARGTHQVLAVMANFVRVHIADEHLAFALLHGNRDALDQTFVVFVLNLKAVNHNFYAMIAIAVELHARQEFLHLSVNSGIEITFSANRFEELLVVSLAVLDERSKQDDAFTQVFVQEQIDYLLFCVAYHLFAANIRKCFGCPCIKQAKEVVNLCCGADCASGVLVRCLLFDADDRTEPRYLIDIRPFHIAQEVACISAESLDIATLAFCINGIKSERRLAASA